jgi:hypothetical protein
VSTPTSAGGNSGSGDSQAQQLARTGIPVAWLVGIALVLMTLGVVMTGVEAEAARTEPQLVPPGGVRRGPTG